eukprot:TRINITY_DN25273_c0_g1_i1.p1 TRINITY_DN25273_c0_g1~~TRINITY_DN25273_c0_g1_i1.p1  ORF type:complete len:597 (+),score=118.86 TRINITY_DN25273_c0_g1_i1:54-1844(+)
MKRRESGAGDPEAHLRKRDLVCEGPKEVTKRVKRYFAEGGDGRRVNTVLSEGYRGDADACTLIAACSVGVGVQLQATARPLAKPPPPPRDVVLSCLLQTLRMNLAGKGLTELDTMILKSATPPKWLEKIMRDPSVAELLCTVWVDGADPDSAFLNYALLKLRRVYEKAAAEAPPQLQQTENPRVAAALAARFPAVLQSLLVKICEDGAGRDPTCQADATHTLLDATRVDYHVLLYATLLLSEMADEPTPAGNVAGETLLQVQRTALRERSGGVVEAAFPCTHPTVQDLLRDETLWTSDIDKLRTAGVRHVARCPMLLDRIVGEAAGNDAWRSLLVEVKQELSTSSAEQSGDLDLEVSAPSAPAGSHDLDKTALFLKAIEGSWSIGQEVTELLESHTREMRQWAQRCALSSSMCLRGLCAFLTRKHGVLNDASSLATFVLALRCALSMVEVRPSLAVPAALRVCLCGIVTHPAGDANEWQEGAALHAVAGFLVAAALAPSPVPYAELFVSDAAVLGGMNKTVLHFLLALLPVYLPPPYTAALAVQLQELARHPAVADALRTSLPDTQPFRPRGAPRDLLDYRQHVSALQATRLPHRG